MAYRTRIKYTVGQKQEIWDRWKKRMNLNIKNKIVMVSCLSLALVVILAFIANHSIKSLVETANLVEHTHQVLEQASKIEKLILDMETGERGYLIAGKQEFLEPYEAGKQLLSEVLVKTKKLVSDNPEQIKRLGVIEKKIELWHAKAGFPEIEKRREVAQNSEAIKTFKSLQSRTVGKKIFDNIRYEFKLIRSEFELENNLRGIIFTSDSIKSLVDMETGQRGFLLTGMDESLEPFVEGEKTFNLAVKKLNAFSEKSKSRRIIKRGLTRIEVLVKEWLTVSVTPEIEARRRVNQLSSVMSDVTELIEQGTGKRIMDELRTKLLIFKQVENELMATRKVDADRGILLARSVIIFGTLIILILSLFGSFWLANSISRPINLLKLASVGVGKGVYPGKIYIDSKDEIADLGNAFENMIDKIKSNEKAIVLEKEEAIRAQKSADSARTQAEISKEEAIRAQKSADSARTQAEISKEEAEASRQDAEKANQAKSMFLANMSHEIRTPLNAVLGYAQILQRDESLSDSQLEGIQTINKSGNHLLGLINDILDISKIEAGKQELNKEEFDLGALINELKTLFLARCSEKGLALEMENYPEGETIIYGDLGKLRQVMLNLIGNAVKFTDSGSVGCRFSNKGSDNHFLFEVTDTGSGIPKDAQELIFEPFKQDEEGINKGGTGLGLAISHKQIKQMDGELKLDSEPGKGSRFYFSIPLERRKGRRSESTNNPDNKYENIIGIKGEYKIKALVVDDVKENRDVLGLFLQSLGVTVTKAENGKVALDKIAADEPNIIFMDIRMPVMDGIEAFQKIKEIYSEKSIKIICITASTLRHEKDKFLGMGFDSYVSKPFKHADVFETLENNLDIEFDYKKTEAKKTIQKSPAELDWSSIKISPEIKAQILEAADTYNITNLENALGQLKSMENGGKDLGDILKKLAKAYDMDKIIEVMRKIS
jgi:signal transduction histidine kinase/CheY-like chemotaxis protein